MQGLLQKAEEFSKLGGLAATGEGVERLIPSNWAHTVHYTAQRYHAPESVEEVCEIVAHASRVRVIGTRHACSTCADCPDGDLLTLENLPPIIEINAEARTVKVAACVTCADLARALHDEGWALHTLPSLAHVSVAGALATSDHGSGDACGGLISAMLEIEYVDHEGSLVTCYGSGACASSAFGRAMDPDLQGVLLGGLGVIVEVTLAIEEAFDVRTDVYLNLPWSRLEEQHSVNQILSDAYSVSLFVHDWSSESPSSGVRQVWFKRRVPLSGNVLASGSVHAASGVLSPSSRGCQLGRTSETILACAANHLSEPPPPAAELFDAVLAHKRMHPLPGLRPEHCTPQGEGSTGPSHERLPHYMIAPWPVEGERGYMQSEYFVPRDEALGAIRAMRALGERLKPHLLVSELRSVGADELWLSPCHRRPCLAILLTWQAKADEAELRSKVLPLVEAALAPFGVRPNWALLFTMAPPALYAAFSHMRDYRELLARLDPAGKFRNPFINRHIFGQSSPKESAADDAAPLPMFCGTRSAIGPRPYHLYDPLKSFGLDGGVPDTTSNPYLATGGLRGSASALNYSRIGGRFDEPFMRAPGGFSQPALEDHVEEMLQQREEEEAAAAARRDALEAERVAVRREARENAVGLRSHSREEAARAREVAWQEAEAAARFNAAPFVSESRAASRELADVVKRSEEQHDRSLTLADAMAADMNALAKEQKAKESAETMESIHKARTAAGDKTT